MVAEETSGRAQLNHADGDNGHDIQVLQFEGTAQGIPFCWYGYYYTGKGGTIQVITFAGASLFDGFKVDFEDLLNGLQAVDP